MPAESPHWLDRFMPKQPMSERDRNRGRFYVASTLTFIVMSSVPGFGFLLFRFGQNLGLSLLLLCGAVSYVVSLTWYRRGGRLVGPSWQMFITYMALFMVGSMASGLTSGIAPWALALPIAAAYLVGPRQGAAVAGLVALELVALSVLEGYGRIIEIDPQVTTVARTVSPIGSSGLILAVAWLFHRSEQASTALRVASEQRLRALVDNTADLIWSLDEHGNYLELNDACQRAFTRLLRRAPARGEPFVAPNLDEWKERIRRTLAGELSTHEDRYSVNGEVLALDVSLRPIQLAGEHRGVTVVARDVTALSKLREQLVVADRMTTVGTLAAGVAHELNNPLTYVAANLDYVQGLCAELAQAEPERFAEAKQAIADAMEGAWRMKAIIRDLKTFSRNDETRLEVLDLRACVEDALRLCSNELRHRTRLVRELGPAPEVRGNAGKIGQVAVNLLVNAVQALDPARPERNHVWVRTGEVDGRAMFEVHDEGVGMSAAVRARIFDPFFTTKPVGVGTGLGLSICHNIVTALGGSIEVESHEGQGTRFRVLLPAAPDEGKTAPAPKPVRPPDGAQRRILVVDDEANACRALGRLLSPRYGPVVTETSPEAALERLARGEQFELVLCDLMMPQMTGDDLRQAVEGKLGRTSPTFLFMTGGAFTPKTDEFLRRLTGPWLQKPIEGPTLFTAVDAALTHRDGARGA